MDYGRYFVLVKILPIKSFKKLLLAWDVSSLESSSSWWDFSQNLCLINSILENCSLLHFHSLAKIFILINYVVENCSFLYPNSLAKIFILISSMHENCSLLYLHSLEKIFTLINSILENCSLLYFIVMVLFFITRRTTKSRTLRENFLWGSSLFWYLFCLCVHVFLS